MFKSTYLANLIAGRCFTVASVVSNSYVQRPNKTIKSYEIQYIHIKQGTYSS